MARFEVRIGVIARLTDLVEIMKFHHQFDKDDVGFMLAKVQLFHEDERYRNNPDACFILNLIARHLCDENVKAFVSPHFTEYTKPIKVASPTKLKPVTTELLGHNIKFSNEKMQFVIDLSKFNGEDLLEEILDNLIVEFWYASGFNKSLVARRLGLTVKTIYNKFRKIYEQRGHDFFIRDSDCGLTEVDKRTHINQLRESVDRVNE